MRIMRSPVHRAGAQREGGQRGGDVGGDEQVVAGLDEHPSGAVGDVVDGPAAGAAGTKMVATREGSPPPSERASAACSETTMAFQ